ncbi:hypothetical protein M422DRAFT_47943 [Sphaerobolus stellatus SS14]|uniref:Uncharacterized protein n=1 Tax=Sphaerobolus stellatus (strain SS14) TaxID=990650 RepID=A0A0C9VXX7_SPHS4|nr:hypothetical protein M422DRAFT_47943 [Sphaerobolus stellatus SS14]
MLQLESLRDRHGVPCPEFPVQTTYDTFRNQVTDSAVHPQKAWYSQLELERLGDRRGLPSSDSRFRCLMIPSDIRCHPYSAITFRRQVQYSCSTAAKHSRSHVSERPQKNNDRLPIPLTIERPKQTDIPSEGLVRHHERDITNGCHKHTCFFPNSLSATGQMSHETRVSTPTKYPKNGWCRRTQTDSRTINVNYDIDVRNVKDDNQSTFRYIDVDKEMELRYTYVH